MTERRIEGGNDAENRLEEYRGHFYERTESGPTLKNQEFTPQDIIGAAGFREISLQELPHPVQIGLASHEGYGKYESGRTIIMANDDTSVIYSVNGQETHEDADTVYSWARFHRTEDGNYTVQNLNHDSTPSEMIGSVGYREVERASGKHMPEYDSGKRLLRDRNELSSRARRVLGEQAA